MNSETLSELFTRSESDVLDFKLAQYDLGGPSDDSKTKERKRAKFAKDMLAFANQWSDRPRHVVIGAQRLPDGKLDAPGITSHVDGILLVHALDGLVHPCPRFHYAQVEFNGCQYGVIEIAAERSIGPFFATKDVGGADGTVSPILRRNGLYCRRDSGNVEASAGEQAAIWKWFQQGQISPPVQFPSDQSWTRIVEAALLNSHGCHRILILALDETAHDPSLAHLAALDWSLVIDLDPQSQFTGALTHCRARLAGKRALHVVAPDGQLIGDLGKATCWYFAAGLDVVQQPAGEIKYKEWITKYGKAASRRLEELAALCSGPVSLIAICENPARVLIVRKLIEDISSNFGDRVNSVAISGECDDWSTLENQGLATVVALRPRDFLEGLAAHARERQEGPDHVVQLPGASGVPKDISGEDITYLEEDLELVHRTTGLQPTAGAAPMRHFLRGGQITWFDLGLQADVEREKTAELLRMVEKDLEQRQFSRVNLYHEPGAGASTIARRVVWYLHQRYPTVVLKRCVARQTSERIALLYQRTGQPILVMREGSEVPENEADQLANLLAGKHVPCVILQVLRRYTVPPIRGRSIFLSAQLNTAETARFRVALEQEAPTRSQKILQLANGLSSSRTPFLFGLTAFAADFAGLPSYVRNHLAHVPSAQLKILQYLALSYDYGQQALAASHFADLLQVPSARPVDFGRILCSEARGLLVEQGQGRWRPVHQLVSTEILQQTLSSGGDPRLWRSNLGSLAQDFIEFCRSNSPVPPEELQLVLEQICVRRNDAELLSGASAGENRFSRLVSDLPTADAKLRLFERLVELFPDNAHFWAHLGRFHSTERRDFAKAEQAIDRALAINGTDNVLHHMKGMVLRNCALQKIDEKEPLVSTVALAKRAAESFSEARRLAPDEDYGYISDAQMMLRILDYARQGQGAAATLAKETIDSWVREGFEHVENLLSSVREQRRGEMPSEYEEKCRAELDILYGAHDQALQRWDDLLQRKDSRGQTVVHAPPIRRQIVWLQLARCERRWDQMQPKHLKRSLDLLESNIQQEPNDDRNIRLWIQGARFQSPPPLLSLAADRVAIWRMRGDSLDAIYYLYVLKILDALDGSAIAANDALRNLEICRGKAGFRRDRSRSFEWLGDGKDLRRLVHQDQLGGWDQSTGFWTNTKPLLRVQGIVSRINAPQSGDIELRWGLKAFFVPAAADMALGRDENRKVSFFLGFSYEGLRAWSVNPI